MRRASRAALFVALAGLTLLPPLGQTVGVLLPQDRGPDTLDVSAYPPEMQAAYTLFARKCSKCHTLARPLNTTMRPDYWARYVGQMMQKPASNITERDARTIYGFLSFDQAARKDRQPEKFFPPLTGEEIEALRAKQFGS